MCGSSCLLFSIHSLASTQRMKLRALGNEERGDRMKAWAKSFYLSAAWGKPEPLI